MLSLLLTRILCYRMSKTFDTVFEAASTNCFFLKAQRAISLMDEEPTPPPFYALTIASEVTYWTYRLTKFLISTGWSQVKSLVTCLCSLMCRSAKKKNEGTAPSPLPSPPPSPPLAMEVRANEDKKVRPSDPGDTKLSTERTAADSNPVLDDLPAANVRARAAQLDRQVLEKASQAQEAKQAHQITKEAKTDQEDRKVQETINLKEANKAQEPSGDGGGGWRVEGGRWRVEGGEGGGGGGDGDSGVGDEAQGAKEAQKVKDAKKLEKRETLIRTLAEYILEHQSDDAQSKCWRTKVLDKMEKMETNHANMMVKMEGNLVKMENLLTRKISIHKGNQSAPKSDEDLST